MSNVPLFPPFTSATGSPQERIYNALQELKKRGVKEDYCPRCETHDWTVDILEIPAKSAMSKVMLLTAGLPAEYAQEDFISVLAIVCRNCGYTMFHTLTALERLEK
jgi:predicted nucleic-acid-binding Zn-ribbon protein